MESLGTLKPPTHHLARQVINFSCAIRKKYPHPSSCFEHIEIYKFLRKILFYRLIKITCLCIEQKNYRMAVETIRYAIHHEPPRGIRKVLQNILVDLYQFRHYHTKQDEERILNLMSKIIL